MTRLQMSCNGIIGDSSTLQMLCFECDLISFLISSNISDSQSENGEVGLH